MLSSKGGLWVEGEGRWNGTSHVMHGIDMGQRRVGLLRERSRGTGQPYRCDHSCQQHERPYVHQETFPLRVDISHGQSDRSGNLTGLQNGSPVGAANLGSLFWDHNGIACP